jgi:hypothetical protein
MNAQQRSARARKGGLGLVKARGAEHMRAIGCKGAQVFYTLYEWQPAGLTQFALVRKSDHVIIAFSDGRPVNRREVEAIQ